MRSGRRRSGIVVPSARNSGLDKMSNRTPGRLLVSERGESLRYRLTRSPGLLQDLPHDVRRAAGDGALFHHNLVTLCVRGDHASGRLKVRQVWCLSGSSSGDLGRCVDTDKDNVCTLDGACHIGREEQILLAALSVASFLYNL